MAEKLYHQGSRLKNFVDKSGLTITEIVKRTGIAKSSMYDMFSKEELLFSKIKPILYAIDIDADTFNGRNSFVGEPATEYGYKAMYESLLRENELLKKQLADKEEIIALLKSNK